MRDLKVKLRGKVAELQVYIQLDGAAKGSMCVIWFAGPQPCKNPRVVTP